MTSGPNDREHGTLLEAAMSYAENGWFVMPLHSIDGGRCTCRKAACDSPGKHPRTARGLKDATNDVQVITEWWRKWPKANVGVVTGQQSGFIAIDVDPRHDGHQTIGLLQKEFGDFPVTVTAITGSGGRHFLFAAPATAIRNSSGRLGQRATSGIDVRGDGGYVVVAPSNHVSGGQYAWEPGRSPLDLLPAPLPAWLAKLLTADTDRSGNRTRRAHDRDERVAQAVRAMQRMTLQDNADGSKRLFAAACRAVEHDLSDDDALRAMRAYALLHPFPRAYSDAEILQRIRDAEKQVKRGTVSCSVADLQWEQPAPLGHLNVPAFPVDGIPERLCAFRAICAEVAEAYQVPVDLPALIGLAAGAIAVQRRVRVFVSGSYYEPLNLYVVVALPPADRKSAVCQVMAEPIVAFEAEERQRLAPAMEASARERRILLKRIDRLERACSMAEETDPVALEQLEVLTAKLRMTPEVIAPRFLTDDASPEALSRLIHVYDGRMGVLSAEGGELFELMGGRYSKTSTPNLGVYLKGHAGDDLRVDRTSPDRPPEYVRRPALTLGLAVQPSVLNGLAAKPGFHGRGLLGRFLYSLPASRLGYRRVEPPGVSSNTLESYEALLQRGLRLRPPSPDKSHVVRFEQAALREVLLFQAEIEERLRESGDLAPMRDWAGKCVGLVCRIAGIYHCLLYAELRGLADKPIDVDTARAAISLGRYAIDHAKAAYGEMGADPAIEMARRLLKWVQDQGVTEFTRRDAFIKLRPIAKKVTDADPALDLLVQHGYLRDREQNRSGPGRKPSAIYDVNPHAHKAQNAQNPDAA